MTYTIIYTVRGERYRDATGTRAALKTRLAEIRFAGFPAWLESNWFPR